MRMRKGRIFLGTSFFGQILGRLDRALILPHGDEALDPTTGFPPGSLERRLARRISDAAHKAAWWKTEPPDLVFLSSPHGVSLTNEFCVYADEEASGYADVGVQGISDYTAALPKIPLASALLPSFLQHLDHPNVTTIKLSDMPLRWGEVVPLLMLHPRASHHIVWTYPNRRFLDARAMVPELLHLGQSIAFWLDQVYNGTAAVVISGDLSHTHRADGPYGYSNTSQPMDEALGKWAANPCKNAEHLLIKAASLQDRALSCGFTGFVLLHGMLCEGNSPRQWDGRVLVNHNITYFGMMVAEYQRRHNETVIS